MTDNSETHGHDSERGSRPSRRQVLTTVAGGLVCGAPGSRAFSGVTDSTSDETRQETAERGSSLSSVAAETDASLSVQNTPATDTGGGPSAADTSPLPGLSTLLVYAAAAVGDGAAGLAAIAGLLRLRQWRGSEATGEADDESGSKASGADAVTSEATSAEHDDTTRFAVADGDGDSADTGPAAATPRPEETNAETPDETGMETPEEPEAERPEETATDTTETAMSDTDGGTRLTFGTGVVADTPEQAVATAGGGSAVIAPAVALSESNAERSDGRGPAVQQCTQFVRCATASY